ncbi:phage head closure protein [Paenibacillus gallinarum]|uniref:Phage head closure protein n=1 Tax=Paenibacillus gallinarum TaxID=2762232 RepID=A0ABR8SW76_9BACL|nr:phage head closure protein [Paenibacillus gallinarum]MBD7967763.1 phage head closure protein [Paenibacillus gallinarum]
MNPAKLNKRITLQKKVTGEDNSGYPTPGAGEWEEVISIYASRKPIRGREFFAAAAAQAENTVRFEIRYRSGITPDMRLVCEGRIYNITAVLDDVYGDRTETHLMTTEVLQNG